MLMPESTVPTIKINERPQVNTKFESGWISVVIDRKNHLWTDSESFKKLDLKQKHSWLKLQGLVHKDDRQYALDMITDEVHKDDWKDRKERPQNYKESNEILTLILQSKKDEATEKIADHIMKNEHIYTTRDDDKAEIWIYYKGIYVPQGKTFINEICRLFLGEAYSTNITNRVIAKIEVDTYIDANKFFTYNKIDEIAVENGLLNIFTKELRDFTPKEIFFNKIPVKFDPDAKCPAISKHLKEVLKNPRDSYIIEELAGFFLLKEYKYEKAFMLLGGGRNGKGKTLELLKRFIGIDNCANIPLQQLETDPFSMGELFNKLANLSGDIDKKALNHTGTFKTLTGRDMVSASRKFKNRINFVNYAKMVFLANELPETQDLTIAFFDRWILLDFPYTFLSQNEYDMLDGIDRQRLPIKIADPEIIIKLTQPEELSGLLNLALEGLSRLTKQKDFSYTKSNDEVKKMWLRKSSSLSAFLMDCVEEKYDGYVKKSKLRQVYSKYCKDHKLIMTTDKKIKETLAINFGAIDGRKYLDDEQVYVWEGIKIKESILKQLKIS